MVRITCRDAVRSSSRWKKVSLWSAAVQSVNTSSNWSMTTTACSSPTAANASWSRGAGLGAGRQHGGPEAWLAIKQYGEEAGQHQGRLAAPRRAEHREERVPSQPLFQELDPGLAGEHRCGPPA